MSDLRGAQSSAVASRLEQSTDPVDDPLLQRLQDKFTSMRTHDLQQKRKQWDTQLAGRADRHKALNPSSVELLADETVVLLNELDGLCSSHQLTRGAELVRQVRTLTNRQLRESLAYLEDGYSSAFHELLREADYKSRERVAAPKAPPAQGETTTSQTPEADALLKQCPAEWKANVKEEVVKEMLCRSRREVTNVDGKKTLSVRETLSVTTGLFAESLASLLFCEVVRVYLYDEHRNLHCVATYPYHAVAGDPMHVTFKEMMIAKELHSIVCGAKLAVNASEPQYKMLGRRDVQLIERELQASGLDSLRSCLIFPIIPHTGDRAAYGMIHAVNKVSTGREPASFDSADEVLTASAARLLGCMLTRYPVECFTARVGESFHRAVFPGDDTRQLDAHLPERLVDEVEDAAEAGNRALASREGMQIFRAPLSDVYQTPLQRSKLRKLGNLALEDNTLSAVEFNLKSVRELWQSGFDENVVMHRKYRELAEQSNTTKLLLQNVLDGLAAARSFHDPEAVGKYLQTLELLARSESTESLSAFISDTLMNSLQSTAPDTRSPPTQARETDTHSPPRDSVLPSLLPQVAKACGGDSIAGLATQEKLPIAGGDGAASGALFLGPDDVRDLLRSHQLRNRKVAARIHVDGPECVRLYSTDPATKREQVRFIEGLAQSQTVARTSPTVRTAVPSTRHLPPSTPFRTTGSSTTRAGVQATNSHAASAPARPFYLRRAPAHPT